MTRMQHTSEQIISKLREVKVELAKGQPTVMVLACPSTQLFSSPRTLAASFRMEIIKLRWPLKSDTPSQA